MNALTELLSLMQTSWSAPMSAFNGGAIVLVVVTALIGMISVDESDDPSDF
jgi:hypothetical protein